VASTRSRPHGREHARPSTGGVAAEHATKIYTVAVIGIMVIVAFLALTSIGHVVDAATQHFMLFYSGVFALIGLCTSVGLGLVATDRMFLHPGQRVFIQAAHRAASFGAVTFLIIHITTEILAQRSHPLDAVIPFLSPFRTFYVGLGTIASDLIILLVITGIMRGRFNASGKAWRWRAIHYTSYLALVFGVWHGLLAGRPGKPYVDWSYGFVVAFVLLGLAVRVLSNSLRPKENLSAPPVDLQASSASAPLRAAAMLAQHGATMRGGRNVLGSVTGSQPMLAAPVTATVLTASPAIEAAPAPTQQPFYEPGYEGPPRYLGAPRDTGPRPRPTTGSMPRSATGPLPRPATGPMPRANTGSMPRVPTGPMPTMPRHPSGPLPTMGSGPMPTMGNRQLPPSATGPIPRGSSRPVPRDGSGPHRTMSGSGPYPVQSGSGPYPVQPQSWTGPMPRANTGAMPQIDDDWDSRPERPSAPRGPMGPPRGGTGPTPVWSDSGRPAATGPMPRYDGRPDYQDRSDYNDRPDYRDRRDYQDQRDYEDRRDYQDRRDHQDWPEPSRDRGWPEPAPDRGWVDTGLDPAWLEASHDEVPYTEQPPWDGYFPESDPDLKYREPGPGMPGYRGSREHRYGGDRY
jgi:DMSO/TMAO reductase YedYZ heme-binding membrane subunit